MIRRPPRSTRTDTLFPYTTLFRSVNVKMCILIVTSQTPFALSLSKGRSFSSPPQTRTVLRQAQHKRSEEHTSELQSLMRISYAVFCLNKKNQTNKSKSNEYTLRLTETT